MHYRGHGVLQVAVFIILNLDQKKFTYIDTPFNWLYPAESFSSNWYKFPQLAQKIPPTSFNPIVRYRIHKGPWHVLILSQINLVYYHAIDPQTFQVASFTQVSPPIFCTGSSPPPNPHSCLVPPHSQISSFELTIHVWWGVQSHDASYCANFISFRLLSPLRVFWPCIFLIK